MEKGGLTDALQANALTAEHTVGFGDEMRVGLFGQVRRVLAPRGIAVRQPRQIKHDWVYLALAVDGREGRVSWTWLCGMDESEIALAVQTWQDDGFDGVVWDGASSHKAASVGALGVPLIVQPPLSPELNPAERFFEELRKEIEGTVYPRIEEKVLKVENTLRQWAADPERIKQLCGWDWIEESFECLQDQAA